MVDPSQSAPFGRICDFPLAFDIQQGGNGAIQFTKLPVVLLGMKREPDWKPTRPTTIYVTDFTLHTQLVPSEETFALFSKAWDLQKLVFSLSVPKDRGERLRQAVQPLSQPLGGFMDTSEAGVILEISGSLKQFMGKIEGTKITQMEPCDSTVVPQPFLERLSRHVSPLHMRTLFGGREFNAPALGRKRARLNVEDELQGELRRRAGDPGVAAHHEHAVSADLALGESEGMKGPRPVPMVQPVSFTHLRDRETAAHVGLVFLVRGDLLRVLPETEVIVKPYQRTCKLYPMRLDMANPNAPPQGTLALANVLSVDVVDVARFLGHDEPEEVFVNYAAIAEALAGLRRCTSLLLKVRLAYSAQMWQYHWVCESTLAELGGEE